MNHIIVMVIMACLSQHPQQCREFRMPLDADISMKMCQNMGQIGLAQWAGEHPAFTIRRYGCISSESGERT